MVSSRQILLPHQNQLIQLRSLRLVCIWQVMMLHLSTVLNWLLMAAGVQLKPYKIINYRRDITRYPFFLIFT